MTQLIQVAIQARRASTRLPDKALLTLGDRPLVEHCIDNAYRAADYIQKKFFSKSYEIDVNLLVPQSEAEFWNSYSFTQDIRIVPGSETDVLDRYIKLFDKFKPEFMVRMTADCPNVPFLVVNKAIAIAINHRLDYVTNAWEKYRTSPDGHDVEVLSAKAITWLAKNAKSDYDREHVTTAIRENRDAIATFRDIGFKAAVLLAKEDLSGIKLCIDTKKDYEECRKRFASANQKYNQALTDRLGVYEY